MRIRILALLLALLAAFPAEAKLKLPHLPHKAAKPQINATTVAGQAIRAADANRWAEAHEIAAKSGDPVLVKLIEWLDCSRPGTDAGFARITAFAHVNPDWPNMGALDKRAEDAIAVAAPDNVDILAWFDAHKVQNPDNMGLYFDALQRAGRQDDAVQKVRDLWVDGNFTTPQANDYRQRYAQILTQSDDEARADRLIWDKAYADARAMLPLLGPANQAAVSARIALLTHGDTSGAEESTDPGLLFARASAEEAQLNDTQAAAILKAAPENPPHPGAWSVLRLAVARSLLESHDYQQAYEVAGADRAREASQIAESQFLAGWIALRFLKDPETAAKHFVYMYDHVESPISKSRAAFWAAETKQDPAGVTTEQWLQRAAAHPTAFYGQIAAERLGRPLILPPEPRPSAAEIAHFERGDLARAARLFHQANDTNRVSLFVTRLGELAKEPTQAAMVVHLARDVGSIPVSVQIAKKMLQNNVCTLQSGYPLLDNVHVAAPELAFVHSIIRQESLFNPVIVSPAGAIGLMQLMPATAASTARKIGARETTASLSQNPSLNVTLGSAYLASMIDHYGGSYALATAAYNGGPGNVNNWLQDNGDPRSGNIDMLDWIELIPLQETRNYVQRVLENLQVYRARLNGGAAPIQIIEDLRR